MHSTGLCEIGAMWAPVTCLQKYRHHGKLISVNRRQDKRLRICLESLPPRQRAQCMNNFVRFVCSLYSCNEVAAALLGLPSSN